MTRWTAVVVTAPEVGHDEMVSRLPTFLHPIAGRPLVWHTVAALARLRPAPARVVVCAGPELSDDFFHDIGGVEIRVLSQAEPGQAGEHALADGEGGLLLDAAAALPAGVLQELFSAPPGSWMGDQHGMAAARLDAAGVLQAIRRGYPVLADGIPGGTRVPTDPGVPLRVRSRAALARVAERVRDELVAGLMSSGVTLLLPHSVLVDVDVRVGRDSVIYPGVVLEGQSTIGEETVIGPGCRIIDSWVGSGVELKGWNYISHTSVRNRAILEPYVRRGFD